METLRLSETEWAVLHASQDAGPDATPDRVAVLLPGLHPATVQRTRRRLRVLGFVRPDGTRVRVLARSPRGPESVPSEAEVRAAVAAVFSEKSREREILPIAPRDVIATMEGVTGRDAAETCREIVRIFDGGR